MTLLLVAGLASNSGLAVGWEQVQARHSPTLCEDQAIVPESRFMRRVLDLHLLTETRCLVEDRQTMPIRANSYGNKDQAIRIRNEQVRPGSSEETKKVIHDLLHDKLYYGFNAEEILFLIKILRESKVPVAFESEALEHGIGLAEITGPFVIGRLEKDGPLMIRLQENSLGIWRYQGFRNDSASLQGPRKTMFDQAFVIAAMEMTGTTKILEALGREPQLRDIVIEIRSHHDWVGETLTPTWDETRFILHAGLFQNLNLLVWVLIEELGHVLKKNKDDIPSIAKNISHFIHAVGLDEARHALEFVSGFTTRLARAFNAAEKDLQKPRKEKTDDLRQAIFEKLALTIATAIIKEKPSLLLGPVVVDDPIQKIGSTKKAIMRTLKQYPPHYLASAEMIRYLLPLPMVEKIILRLALDELVSAGALFRFTTGRAGKDTLYSLQPVSSLPDAGRWTKVPSRTLEFEILDLMQKHHRPVTQSVLRFFFQDFAIYTPYYQVALTLLMRHGQISISRKTKPYQYTLLPLNGRSKARTAA